MRAPRNKLAKLASKLDSNAGEHHWPAPLASTINATGQQHWPPPLVSTTGRHHWPGPLTTCSKHVDDDDDDDDDDDADADDYDDDDDDDANDDGDGWPAPLASTMNTTGQQHWPPPLVSTTSRHHWPGPLATCFKHVDDSPGRILEPKCGSNSGPGFRAQKSTRLGVHPTVGGHHWRVDFCARNPGPKCGPRP